MLLCRVVLSLLRAVQTVSSTEEWPQPPQAGSPVLSNWHFPSCPHSLHQYSQPERRRPLGRGGKWEWERRQHSTGIQWGIEPSWAILLPISLLSLCCYLLAEVSIFSLNTKHGHCIKHRNVSQGSGVSKKRKRDRQEDTQRQIQTDWDEETEMWFECSSTILAKAGPTAQGLRKWLTLLRYHRMMCTCTCVSVFVRVCREES